jgi:hypothetical protein
MNLHVQRWPNERSKTASNNEEPENDGQQETETPMNWTM